MQNRGQRVRDIELWKWVCCLQLTQPAPNCSPLPRKGQMAKKKKKKFNASFKELWGRGGLSSLSWKWSWGWIPHLGGNNGASSKRAVPSHQEGGLGTAGQPCCWLLARRVPGQERDACLLSPAQQIKAWKSQDCSPVPGPQSVPCTPQDGPLLGLPSNDPVLKEPSVSFWDPDLRGLCTHGLSSQWGWWSFHKQLFKNSSGSSPDHKDKSAETETKIQVRSEKKNGFWGRLWLDKLTIMNVG